jgi:hypothetical protein
MLPVLTRISSFRNNKGVQRRVEFGIRGGEHVKEAAFTQSLIAEIANRILEQNSNRGRRKYPSDKLSQTGKVNS